MFQCFSYDVVMFQCFSYDVVATTIYYIRRRNKDDGTPLMIRSAPLMIRSAPLRIRSVPLMIRSAPLRIRSVSLRISSRAVFRDTFLATVQFKLAQTVYFRWTNKRLDVSWLIYTITLTLALTQFENINFVQFYKRYTRTVEEDVLLQ